MLLRLCTSWIVVVVLLTSGSTAYGSINPTVGGTGGNTLVAWSTNQLSVTQSIQDLGGGTWEYTFNIASVEPSNVWQLLVYTPFATHTGSSTFPNTAPNGINLNGVFAGYDARNIDPTLTHVSNIWYTPFGGSNGLLNGGSATYQFRASVLDPSAKLFAYETGASGYLGNLIGPGGSQRMVHAFGYAPQVGGQGAIPEPAAAVTWSLLGLAGMALVGFRRRRRGK